MKDKGWIIKILGIFLIIYGISAIIQSVYFGSPERVFWFCYIGMILIGIGALIKDIRVIISQINILLIPLILWNLDFFIRLFSGKSYLMIVDYFFEEMLISARIISFEHLILLPLSIFLIYLLVKDRKIKINYYFTLFLSVIQVSVVFIIVRIFSSNGDNVNCILDNCYFFLSPIVERIPYVIAWFLVYFAMVIASNFVMSLVIKRIGEK